MEFTVLEEQYRCRTMEYFWFFETKQAIQEIVDHNIDFSEIDQLSKNENFFSAVSSSRARETTNGVIRRLKVADEAFFTFFMKQPIELQKLLVLVLMMVDNRTIFEFMNDVFKEKLLFDDMTITDGEVIGFIHSIQEKDVKAAEWSDSSVKKLRSSLKGYLRESSLAVTEGRNLKIMKPILSQAFIDFLAQENLEVITKVFMGER